MAKPSLPSPVPGRSHGLPRREGPRLQWYPYLNVPKEGDLLAVILSNELLVLETHWVNETRAVVYCAGARDCPFCKMLWSPVLYGYAAAQRLEVSMGKGSLGSYGLLAIPEDALYNSPSLMLTSKKLRGQILRQFRFVGHGFTSAVRAELQDLYSHADRLRPAWDVRQDMARRFGFAPEKLRPITAGEPYEG